MKIPNYLKKEPKVTIKSELLDVFKDTNGQCGLCNITFKTFLLANYSEEYIKEHLPLIFKQLEVSIILQVTK